MVSERLQERSEGVVQTLLARGEVDVNKRGVVSFISLHFVCQRGTRDIVSLLMENSADACTTSNDRITPLHMCARSGNKNNQDIDRRWGRCKYHGQERQDFADAVRF